MHKVFIFLILTFFVIILSRKSLFHFHSHGFYRFFSWECILWLLVSNSTYWFANPLSVKQIISWILLFYSVYLVIAGAILLKKVGNPTSVRKEESLYAFENTTILVETGIFSFIRHPLYSSLLFLTWGILLKNVTIDLLIIALISSILLYITAIRDEKECIVYFGEKYILYMKRSKMFIPFIF